MNNSSIIATKVFLANEMEKLLPKLDEVTHGDHPIWDKDFARIMAEAVLQIIIAGNYGEEHS